MAEITYKKISDLDNATVPLTGSELIGVSATGVSKKATIENMHGAGWWTKLKAAFVDFVAPNATHAVDSDTCGEESPSDFHDAAQLTGNIHLDRIPAELTGKNAATATLAATATNALACSGNAASADSCSGTSSEIIMRTGTPSGSSPSTNTGTFAFDASYVYIKIPGTNTWKRIAAATVTLP